MAEPAAGVSGSTTGAAYDVIVVGGGHNGLVTGAYLAKAGLRTLILEARSGVGGAAATSELLPGFRVPTVAHTVGRLRPSVARDLRLREHGLALVSPEVRVFAPQPGGRALTLWADPARTAAELGAWSAADAANWPEFDRQVRSIGGFVARLANMTPPDMRSPGRGDAFSGLGLARSFRGLPKGDARDVTRLLPMAVADYAAEHFATDALRGLVAARGVQYAFLGPWSAGSTAALLADSAGNDGGGAGQTVFARGGPGALAETLAAAARAFGAEIRTDALVAQITTLDGRVTGVALASGEEIAARAVASAVDPKRTLLRLVDPAALGPSLVWRAGNLRLPGAVAKVNLALGELPVFVAAGAGEDGARRLRGRIVVGATGIDPIERAFDAAKHGGVSPDPLLEATIPSLVDPGLAPDGKHVMSVVVQYAPYHLKGSSGWDKRRREKLGASVVAALEEVAPGIGGLVEARQVITPLDLERDYGLTEGHPMHGEQSLDQWFAWRPLLGHARYRLGGIAGLYLCASGAHPGGGITGSPGANAAGEIVSDLKRRRR